METTNNWSEDSIRKQIEENMKLHESDATSNNIGAIVQVDTQITRKLLIIGCGDGGCNIASDIRSSIPDSYAIVYNTSVRAMNNINADAKIIPEEEDGSGKVREYSKQVFKDGSYKELLNKVNTTIAKNDDIKYIIVTTTADGGTGSGISPMVAKFIHDNTQDKNGDQIPVIIVGVYPSIAEDATAQYNAMTWQADVEKTGLPYMIYDNNIQGSSKLLVHHTINHEIVVAMKLIAGRTYGNSNISMIDNHDIYMLLSHVGGRIVYAENTIRPTVNQNMDDYVFDMINKNNQPLPSDVHGIGIFVKGNRELIEKVDTSLMRVKEKYGNAEIQYTHLEESDFITISILLTGCSEPENRLYMMKERYADIMNQKKNTSSSISTMLDDMNNPMGNMSSKKTATSEPDLSALDL